ncbi:MAG TPA: hypothetical protein VGC07_08025 [Granulicella sp.]
MNVLAGLIHQDALPNHAPNLEQSHEYQSACQQDDSVLYLEILSALLAGLIATWGGWLWGGGNRGWGSLVIALSLWLFLSFTTAVTFGDPLFWRVGMRLLIGNNPYQYERVKGNDEYRQRFQHDGENVSQKLVDSESAQWEDWAWTSRSSQTLPNGQYGPSVDWRLW